MKSRIVVSLTMVAIFMLMASSVSAQPPRVNVMPGNAPCKIYPYTWPGRVLTIWGNVHDGTPPYTYVWELGDGTPSLSGTVTDPKYISVTHAYATMGTKPAVLTVTDANGLSDDDTVEIEVVIKDFPVEVNASIEDGLRFLYLQQQPDGRWIYGGYPAAATAMALLALENNQHLPINDINEDIYAEYVQAGLDYLFTTFYSTPVPVQGAGDPEADAPGNTDHNGIGIGVNSSRNGYETGMAMMAIVGSGPLASPAPDLIATTGPAGVIGRTYRDIVIDMVDWCAWAQVEPSQGIYRGGWRYTPNYGDADNSVSQWPTIGLEAAETNWGIAAPAFVKSELLLWLSNSQISGGFYDGAFWYQPGYWPYSPIGVTGAGLCELSYADVPNTDSRVTRTIDYLARDWGHGANVNDRYNLYAVTKGCRIAVPSEIVSIDGIDWYTYYATNLTAIQQGDGGWPDQWGRVLSSAWAILVLTPTVVGLPPVAVIYGPESVPPHTPFNLDGSHSYHMNPCQLIVEWLWDFDKSDGVDWNNPDAMGAHVVNPGYSLPPGVLADTFVVTLRVADNSDPVMTDVTEHTVIVNFENHAPIAVPGGPYAGKIGEIITFDGTGSYDLDSGDYIVSYSWDIDGDGIFGDCTDSVCQFSWPYEYSGYVGLVVTDSYGATSDTAQAYVTVWTSEIDVGIDASGLFSSSPYPMPGDTITIYAAVYCDTASDPVSSVKVRFYEGDPEVTGLQIDGDQIIYDMMAGDVETVQVEWCVPDTFPHEIHVWVDPPPPYPSGELKEYNENNNKAFKVIKGVIARCKLFVTPEVVTVDPGDTAHFMVGVWNMGGHADDYLLRLSGLPGDFAYSLPETVWDVDPNDTMDVPLEITPPYDLPLWSDTPYPFGVACTSLTYPGVSHDTSGVIVLQIRSSPGPRVRFTDVLLDSLIAQVEAADIEAGVKNSLLSKLDNAKKKKEQGLERLEAGDTTVAINMFNAAANILGAFINELEAQRGQKITEGDADSFMAQAEDIIWRLQTGIWEGGSPPAKMAGEDIQSPQRFELYQNIPNPFNPITQISYTLPRDGHVKLEIYNLLGQKVATLVDEYQQTGQKTVNWEAKDLASGIYFYKLSSGDFTATKKMVLLR
jgi:hypothetical protein